MDAHSKDIRDRAWLSGDEVKALNFIKARGPYTFRKFYRSGLRSHIFEVLLTTDVEKETSGEIQDGIRIFPRARPQKMFRIFRNRFTGKEEIFSEIKRYKILLHYLGTRFIARSQEIIVDYRGTGSSRIVLCGLQEYVEGEILDPWRLGRSSLRTLLGAMAGPGDLDAGEALARQNIRAFVRSVRQMIHKTGFIPDLAGVGNLILTPQGGIKLVDINNIVAVREDPAIPLDDKGYPACDVSIEVLSILETKILGQGTAPRDPLFRFFLTPERQAQVRQIEKKFYRKLQGPDPGYDRSLSGFFTE